MIKNRYMLAYFITGCLIMWSTQAMLTLNENHTVPIPKELQIQKTAPKDLSLPSHGHLQKNYNWAKSLLPTLSFETKQRIRKSVKYMALSGAFWAIGLPVTLIGRSIFDSTPINLQKILEVTLMTFPIASFSSLTSNDLADYEPLIDVAIIKNQLKQRISHLSLQEKLNTLQQERTAHIAAHATDRFLFLNEEYYDILKAYDELITKTPPAN